ncbi:MAG: Hpt domain-containing protein [Hymenobacteraceae bacterium]|mgnify:CR=1 FL=1|nr:Hpt domain-containing protein [Hymenobacteraceae bacterium]MDX5483224.1 Hpt domain-containing protein [Hymenobacteraceae bacterium]
MLCNLDYIHRLSGGDAGFVREMIRLFLKQAPQELEKLQFSIAANEQANIRQIVHKLKSSVAMVGAESMASELRNMESLLTEEADGLLFWGPFNNLENKFTLVRQELEPMLA